MPMSQNNRIVTQISVLLYPMRELNEILILLAIYDAFWKFPKYTDLYQPLLILGSANIKISQTSTALQG